MGLFRRAQTTRHYPDTGSHIDTEDNGDYTITFSMTLPQQPTDDTPTSIPLDEV